MSLDELCREVQVTCEANQLLQYEPAVNQHIQRRGDRWDRWWTINVPHTTWNLEFPRLSEGIFVHAPTPELALSIFRRRVEILGELRAAMEPLCV